MRLINAADLTFKSDEELRYMIRRYENKMGVKRSVRGFTPDNPTKGRWPLEPINAAVVGKPTTAAWTLAVD